MRKPGSGVATKVAATAVGPDKASVTTVCLALALALVFLAFRIASLW
ncbi:hypothetical protein [Bradyrhizobium sp.]|nr:hypothetical protein [Bradyrhizobium sp.]